MEKAYILRVIDFETTGIPDEETNHSVVEAAFIDVCAKDKVKINHHKTLVVPTTPMDIKAQATHHISESEALTGGITWGAACEFLESKRENQEIIYVAHNADFEKQFFNPDGVKWIDTYKVALRLLPDAPGHSNQVLKYFLGIKDKPEHHPPHRALPDCYVTAEILLRLADESATFNEMIKISKQPPYLTKLNFGKHKGQKFEDVPSDYLQWLSKQSDLDEGVRFAINRVLGHDT